MDIHEISKGKKQNKNKTQTKIKNLQLKRDMPRFYCGIPGTSLVWS